MKKKLTINKYYLIIFFLLITFSSLAQGDPPSPPDGGGGPGTVNDVPISIYGFLLLIIGTLYGILKLTNKIN